ncbi:MAG: ATP-binding protein [Phycisphaerales bacterium]|nr:MAG: ATP-binding protein [Phycisphaerales bacterium]
MTIARLNTLKIKQLLAFKDLTLEFSPGITVLIGANATGKTQVLKLTYGLLRSFREYLDAQDQQEQPKKPHVTDKLVHLFRPDDGHIGRLVHRDVGRRSGSATLTFGAGYFRVRISSLNSVVRHFRGTPPQAIHIPSREVLSIYDGFMAAYENRELRFDESYYDLCKALSASQLRGPRGERARELIEPLIDVLGGRIVLKGSHFVLQSDHGNIEAPLLAEGFRKIGALTHLVANGSLARPSVLLWDEPEANLNPSLVTVISRMLRSLAASGIQVVIATHDFLLTQELSLAAEYRTEPLIPIRFIALSRARPGGAIEAQSGDTLAELGHNPILAEFAAHYDREQQLAAADVGSNKGTRRRRDAD